ncbi:MAG: glycosyltransferase [Pirellulales bacterium]|nr:glycosyltransferase [Pirellulales bacterium]
MSHFHSYLSRRPVAELLLVDDGSIDGTRRLLCDLAGQHAGRCSAAALAVNAGKAEAVRCGMRLAIERGAAAVGYWDADLATPLDEIEHFSRVLGRRPEVAAVLGARLPLAGRRIDRHRLRRAASAACRWGASGALGRRMTDTQCGAKLFRVTETLRRALAWPFRSRWLFDVELLLRLQQLSCSRDEQWYELPVDCWSERAGSKVRAGDYARSLLELARLRRDYRTRSAAGRTEQLGLQRAAASPLVLLETKRMARAA